MIDLQAFRGFYEKIVIDSAFPVPVYVENQQALNFDALDEYCFVRFNFGLIQEISIGSPNTWNIRGSLVCEVFTKKGIGPGRGFEIAMPIITALSNLNSQIPLGSQEIIASVGPITGPTQAQLQDRPHFFTRFSMPISVRGRGPS